MTTLEFQAEFLSRATLPAADDPASLINEYVSTRESACSQARGLGVGTKGVREVRSKLAAAFVRRWMMLRFAAIDLSFIHRKWWIKVERNEENPDPRIVAEMESEPSSPSDEVLCLVGSIPRYFIAEQYANSFAFSMDADDEDFNDEGLKVSEARLGTMGHGRRKSASYRSLQIDLSARLPDGLGAKHVRLVRQALGHLQLATALLFARGTNFDHELTSENRYGSRSSVTPQVRIVWAPNLESLSLSASAPRPAGDPAVIFAMGEHSFLLDFYDTPDEKPIEHLIREFSEGKLPNRSAPKGR